MRRNTIDHIPMDKGKTMVENSLLTCIRLHHYYKLLSVLINLVHMKAKRNYHNFLTQTVAKREIRTVLNNCSEDAIDKQLRGLRELGIITTFSKQGGSDGTYSITLAENLDQNPYVQLEAIEKQVIKNCQINKDLTVKDIVNELLNFVRNTAKSVEAKYVGELSSGIDVLEEYRNYLMSAIVKAGLGTFDGTQKKASSKSERNNNVSIERNLLTTFCDKYKTAKNREHPISHNEASAHIRKLLIYCDGDKDKALQFIDVFFKFYSLAKDPKTALLCHENILQAINDYFKDGVEPVVFGISSVKDEKAKKLQEIKEAKQERMGITMEYFDELIGGEV